MGDQDTQTQQEPAWWGFDASADDVAASTSFEEPLQWPDATAWESLFEGGPPTQPVYVPEDFGAGLLFPEHPPADGDGDGGPAEAELEPLPESIWAPDPAGDDRGDAAVVAATVAALGGSATAVDSPTPTAMVEPHAGRRPGPSWMQRFHVRHGSAAVVALACCVSLVLLGMFLSVRARDDLATETSDLQPPGPQIATQASTPPPPPTTAGPTTTASPPSSISLSDLIPADAVADPGGTGGTGGSTARTTAPATTAAPSRSTAPSGGTAGAGSAPQPTNTTAAPDPEPTSPVPTSPPADHTATTPTTAPRTPPTIDFDYTIPSITMPSIPSSPRQPGSAFRATGN